MAKEILLESGTNEVEILEFYLQGQSMGINVAKIAHMVTESKNSPMSLMNEQMTYNREEAEADGDTTKPQINELIEMIDTHLGLVT